MPPELLSLLLAVGGTVLAWLLADARAKGRHDEQTKAFNERLLSAESLQRERQEAIWRELGGKASRDVVTGIEREISSLRDQLNQRLDSIEKLLHEALSERGSG